VIGRVARYGAANRTRPPRQQNRRELSLSADSRPGDARHRCRGLHLHADSREALPIALAGRTSRAKRKPAGKTAAFLITVFTRCSSVRVMGTARAR
jgi:hypothetical protein